jgi:hypothetical protein
MASGKAAVSKATRTVGPRNAAKFGPIDLSGRVNVTELRKPLYASVGVGDLAVAKLRGVPTVYHRRVKDLRGSVRELPQQVRGSIGELPGKATVLYGELAQRGERLLSKSGSVPSPAPGERVGAAGAVGKAAGVTTRRPTRSATKRAAQPEQTSVDKPATAAS